MMENIFRRPSQIAACSCIITYAVVFVAYVKYDEYANESASFAQNLIPRSNSDSVLSERLSNSEFAATGTIVEASKAELQAPISSPGSPPASTNVQEQPEPEKTEQPAAPKQLEPPASSPEAPAPTEVENRQEPKKPRNQPRRARHLHLPHLQLSQKNANNQNQRKACNLPLRMIRLRSGRRSLQGSQQRKRRLDRQHLHL